MSAIPKPFLTPQEYLAKERQAEFKSEYLRGEMFAVAGTRYEHCLVTSNLASELSICLKGSGCGVLISDMRVNIPTTGLYTYPDIVIVCGEPEFEDDVFDTLLNPIAIIEVLSDTTEGYDRGAKFGHYRQIATLREYILVAKDQVLIERYVRNADSSWLLTEFKDITKQFDLVSVKVSVPIAEIYRGVKLPEHPPR